MTIRDCPYCDTRHHERYLCDPGRKVLDAMCERGMSFNLPTIELPEPLPDLTQQLGVGPEDVVLSGLVVKAGMVEIGGVNKPVLLFTGNSLQRRIPRWLLPGNPADLRRAAGLVRDMAELAIRRAKAPRR